MAFVYGVIASASWFGSRLYVRGSMWTKSISAPSVAGAAAVAIHVIGVVMTRSPGLMPSPTIERNNAAVPFVTARAHFEPQFRANSQRDGMHAPPLVGAPW